MKILTTALFFTCAPLAALAGEAENILACINMTKLFSGKVVDEFDVRYTGHMLNFSTAEWRGVSCSVKLGYVDSLTVEGRQYIVDGFAGAQAKTAYLTLEKETEEAVSLLESRVQLLERRLEDARSALQQPEPNIVSIQSHIHEGISRATGN